MRLSRWYVVIPLASFLAFVLVSSSDSQPKRSVPIRDAASMLAVQDATMRQQAELKRMRAAVTSHRLRLWSCQDSLDVRRTRASVSVWALPASVPYRRWTAGVWKSRADGCAAALKQRTIPTTGDWRTAVMLVQRIYPGTASWLLSCSSGEGGHGGFVMNHQGSGAGGWMQFLSSTFYAHYRQAFADARARGFVIDRVHESWYDPMGQALTAAYMRSHGMSSHWDPNIDRLCR